MGGGAIAQLKEWNALVRTDGGVPLVKILVDAGGGKEGLYQFRHLSFQEGLFASDVVRGEGLVSLLPTPPWKPFQDDSKWFANALAIGGDEIRLAICAEAKVKGCTCVEAKEAGYSAREVLAGGYSLRAAGGYSPREAKEAGFALEDVKAADVQARAAEAAFCGTCSTAREAGYSLQEVREAGFSLQEIKEGGYSLQEFREAGYSLQEIREAGFSLSLVKRAGYTREDALHAGYSIGFLAAPSLLSAYGGRGDNWDMA